MPAGGQGRALQVGFQWLDGREDGDFHLLRHMCLVSPVGFKGNLSHIGHVVLNVFFPRGLKPA